MMFKTVPQFEVAASNRDGAHTREACRFFAIEKLFQTHWFVFEYQLDPEALGSCEMPKWRTLLLADFNAVLEVVEQNMYHLLVYRTSLARPDVANGWQLHLLDAAFVSEADGHMAIKYCLQGDACFEEPTQDYLLENSAFPAQVYWPAHEFLLTRSGSRRA